MMGNPKKFIDDIVAFDGNNIDEWKLTMLAPILKEPYFTFEIMKGKSIAAAYLCGWIVNIIIYNTIYKKVKPLKDKAQEA
jgi:dynein heavy chain